MTETNKKLRSLLQIYRVICLACVILMSGGEEISAREAMDLSGKWYFRMHDVPVEIPGEGELMLPGTLDSNNIGVPQKESGHTAQLSRKYKYEGDVSYFKEVEIPARWKNKPIELFIERTRPSTLYIDGVKIGSETYLSSPHIYDVGKYMTPGRHKIEVVVNNLDSIPSSIRKNSHSTSEYTQTNWNGMIGEIKLLAGEEDDDDYPAAGENAEEIAIKSLEINGNMFVADGNPVILRGSVDACVFPRTGYPPMDLQSWENYFDIIKEYGLNHVRFHSWCPPEAAFTAADKKGVYLQVELPVWGELDRDLEQKKEFLRKELEGIISSYSHHPSFALFSVGNELWGDVSLMKEFTDYVNEMEPGILTTLSTNLYSGMNDFTNGDEFLVAVRLGYKEDNSTDLRSSFSFVDRQDGGSVNSQLPGNNSDYSKLIRNFPVPIIAHEVGQYQTYPDFSCIKKYDGVLRPDNFREFERRADEAGTLRKNKEYALASSKWAQKLYKAEVEKYMRTPKMGGFQLMSLVDYPGQGTALVGLLDSFMEAKGDLKAEDWRESCDDIVVMAEFPKYTFKAGETVNIPIVVANYSDKPDAVKKIEWSTSFDNGSFIVKPMQGVSVIGNLTLFLPKLTTPQQFTFTLSSDDGKVKNHYDFWVYPTARLNNDGVYVTKDIDHALALLREGEKVLLTPDFDAVASTTIDPLFSTDFWNYRMFRTLSDHLDVPASPGTLGLLINNDHPALNYFPTESHTDWQWFSIVNNSRPLIIDRLPRDFDPVIEVIDNVERNFRMSMLLECNVGKGKLMILNVDMSKVIDTPEGEWLMQSVKKYMGSKEFKPKVTLTEEQVKNLLTKPSNTRLIRELKNEIYDPHWD